MFRIAFVTLMCATLTMQAKRQKLELQKALDLKLVTAKVSNIGGFQGYCMKLQLKNLAPDSLVVVIEAGRRLNSLDDHYQDILIVKEDIIVLRKAQEKAVNVKGYCCQASNSAPSSAIKYEIGKLADSNLVRLAKYLSSSAYERSLEQSAVWAVSNGHAAASITAKNDSLALPLRKFVANVKREILPWYTLVSSTYVYSTGGIAVTPLLLQGKMYYSNDKDSYITLRVLNEKGVQVCLVKNEWQNACTNKEYDLNLPVKGLAKGKYTIELRSPEKELAKREFEI